MNPLAVPRMQQPWNGAPSLSTAYPPISPKSALQKPDLGNEGNEEAWRARKKQKRNKPTLSCEECVERKTKCDRGRPHCLACLKRQTGCKYAHMANVLEQSGRSASDSRRQIIPPKKRPASTNQQQGPQKVTSRSANPSATLVINPPIGAAIGEGGSNGVNSSGDFITRSASNVFGIGSEHPFANYWTCTGGLKEVIDVMPPKPQADDLLERYFDTVDSVYPYIHRQTFYADYHQYWSLSYEEKSKTDAAFIALVFAMLAMGSQFHLQGPVPDNKSKKTAEFFVSAGHQALRMSSYLNKTSIASIQAMVLITYFLINDNHASDGWAFAGILMRQAYAMGLHRDPNIVAPQASCFEKQQRRKLWQAVLFQDTFLTVLLSLPPSATHTDVNVGSLVDDDFSIASSSPNDTAYIRGCWTLANLVQESICSPRSLSLPIATSPRQKSSLLSSFRAVYRSFPDNFRSFSRDSLLQLSKSNKRLVRQTLFLTSNYWHNVMLLHSSRCAEVPVNVKGTLEAAHEAMEAFFLLQECFGGEARVWWVFCHRAFLQACCVGDVMRGGGQGESGDVAGFESARSSLVRMVDIFSEMSRHEEVGGVCGTRVEVLKRYSDEFGVN